MIDIIIPAYNAHKTIEQTLYSIAIQDRIDDIKVYIVNDCSERDYNEIVNFFSNFFSIQELKLSKNGGPGVARQYGIDHSNSEFIVFIDADDVFTNCYSINNMYDMVNKEESDVVIGSFIEETYDGFKQYDNSYIWLHGKMYRRNFIEKNNIHFNSSRCNEDNGFNQLLFLCNPKISVLNDIIYIWRNCSDSITRKNNHEFDQLGVSGYIYNMNWAMENALKRNFNIDFFAHFAFSVLVCEYHSYLQLYENENIEKQIIKMSKKTLEFSNLYPIIEKDKYDIMKNQFEYTINDNNEKYLLNPIISFDKFMEKIINEGESVC